MKTGITDVFDDGRFLILESFDSAYRTNPQAFGKSQITLVGDEPDVYFTNGVKWDELIGKCGNLHDIGFRFEIIGRDTDYGCKIRLTNAALTLLILNYPGE